MQRDLFFPLNKFHIRAHDASSYHQGVGTAGKKKNDRDTALYKYPSSPSAVELLFGTSAAW